MPTRPEIIDCHGHLTTAPPGLDAFHDALLEPGADLAALAAHGPAGLSDDALRASLGPQQLRLQRERGIDVTLFSPQASTMAHHLGGPEVAVAWARASNDVIHRACTLYPDRFAGVCQLPQSPAPGLSAPGRQRRGREARRAGDRAMSGRCAAGARAWETRAPGSRP